MKKNKYYRPKTPTVWGSKSIWDFKGKNAMTWSWLTNTKKYRKYSKSPIWNKSLNKTKYIALEKYTK